MPSGFQQSNNQLQPNYYRVVVDLTGYPTADGNTNGAVTPNSSDSFTTANLPSTLAKGKQRARGNMRFRNIVNRLSNLADCQIVDIEISEANGDAQATAIAFSVKYDRDAGLIGAVTKLNNSTTAVDGSTEVTTTVLAIKDQVVRGIRDTTVATVRVYDGTSAEDTQQSITVTAPDTIANVWADVTVAAIDGTTVISTDNDVA
jgi:hypothetical protein